jgi:hypothetical protein
VLAGVIGISRWHTRICLIRLSRLFKYDDFKVWYVTSPRVEEVLEGVARWSLLVLEGARKTEVPCQFQEVKLAKKSRSVMGCA